MVSTTTTANRAGRTRGRWLGWLLLAVLAAGGMWYGLVYRPEALAAEGRQWIEALPEPASPRAQREAGERAGAALTSAVASLGERPDLMVLLGTSELLRGEVAAAEQTLRRVDLSRVDSAALRVAARWLVARGALATADRVVAELLMEPEPDVEMLKLAAQVHYGVMRDDDAVAECRMWSQLAPADPAPWLQMALCYERQSKPEQLIEALRRHIELAGDAGEPHRLQVLEYLLRLKQGREARREFELIQSRRPDLLPADSLYAARLLQLEGQLAEAAAMTERYLHQFPKDRSALLVLGQVRMSLGRAAEAVGPLVRLVELDPTDHMGQHLLGLAYQKLGRERLAEQHLAEHRRLLQAKSRAHQLQMQASHEPRNVAVRLELAELCDAIGWPTLADEWRLAADAARAGQDDVPSAMKPPAP